MLRNSCRLCGLVSVQTGRQKSREAEQKLETHDQAIKKAERVLAQQLTLETVLPGPPIEREK